MLSLDRRCQQKSTDQQNAFISIPDSTPRGPIGEPVAFPPYRTPPVRVPALDESVFKAMPCFPSHAVPRASKPLTAIPIVGTHAPMPCSSASRRTVVYIAVSMLLLFITIGTLIAVLPVGTDAKGFNLLLPLMHLIPYEQDSGALMAAQVATATAVTADGYDPGGHQVYVGVQSVPSSPASSFLTSDTDSLSRFFYGQCTYWSNMRYRQLTSHWVPWLGDAYQWAYAAPSYGWIISAQPNPNGPSIIVLAPYAQGSGRFGHVAVVENAVPSSTDGVLTSNWNWNGHWAALDWVRFYPGPGVSFLWYPGS